MKRVKVELVVRKKGFQENTKSDWNAKEDLKSTKRQVCVPKGIWGNVNSPHGSWKPM